MWVSLLFVRFYKNVCQQQENQMKLLRRRSTPRVQRTLLLTHLPATAKQANFCSVQYHPLYRVSLIRVAATSSYCSCVCWLVTSIIYACHVSASLSERAPLHGKSSLQSWSWCRSSVVWRRAGTSGHCDAPLLPTTATLHTYGS